MAKSAVVVAAFTLLLAACSSATNDTAVPSSAPPVEAVDVADISEICRSDLSYRAIVQETDAATGEALTEIFHEVGPDQQRIEATSGNRLLVLADQSWTYTDDVWEQLPVTPVRPLRVPWVNNFVTGSELVDAMESVGNAAGGPNGQIAVRVYAPTLAEMESTFPDKFRESEYDPATSTFDYWIDACDDIIFADVQVTFAGDHAALAEEMGIPGTLRYTYELYDVGIDVAPVTPNTAIDPIPRPGS